MPNYDFKILQPSEFEVMSRDLIQVREGVFIESFTEGRDEGIDFRFATNRNRTIIIQAKRYKDYNSLLGVLRNEVTKVNKLAPSRYILSTSVGLTPQNKDEIKDLFKPYITDTNDILGKDDLNNLLGLYPDVEKRNYKLWLSSIAVLESILNKRIHNWAEFEMERIQSDIHLYVQNESFNKALNILSEHRYIIISGIPGIGKTTLARMLIYHLLANGYEDFYYIPSNIDDAVTAFSKTRKQVFFFDDFLGSNVFEKDERKFDQKIISFIDMVQRSKNKYFILTTREYILSEAKTYYEKFELYPIDIAKCTLDLKDYTKQIRAAILYNHLAEADIPSDYVEALLDRKSYLKLINHHNFNPRVIETFIRERIWERVSPKDFVIKLMEFFYRPFSVWEYSFKELNDISKYALFVLATMDPPVRLEDWKSAFDHFCATTRRELNLRCDELHWKESLKILIDCFIRTQKDGDIIAVEFYNPSVKDFICLYLNENRSICYYLLKSCYYIEQIYSIFCDSNQGRLLYKGGYSDIELKREDYDIVCEQFETMHESKRKCKLITSFPALYQLEGYNELMYLDKFRNRFPIICEETPGLIEKHLSRDILIGTMGNFVRKVALLKRVNIEACEFDISDLILHLKEKPYDCEDYVALVELAEQYDCLSLLDDENFRRELDENIQSEVESLSSVYSAEELLERTSDLVGMLPNWSEDYSDSIHEKIDEIKREEDDVDEDAAEEAYYRERYDETLIHEMFTSLRIKETD